VSQTPQESEDSKGSFPNIPLIKSEILYALDENGALAKVEIEKGTGGGEDKGKPGSGEYRALAPVWRHG